MDVDPARTKQSTSHEGQNYFFCSAGCLEKFRREPAKYLAGGGHEAMESTAPTAQTAPAGKGVEYTCPIDPEIMRPGPGSCPICGMALEPRTISLDDAPNPELIAEIPPRLNLLLRLLLATSVVLWASWPFFERGWTSVRTRSPS